MRYRSLLVACSLLALAACQRHVAESWPDGSPRRSGEIVDGYQAGPWTYRYAGGGVAAQGSFAHSMQEGGWTYRHENGTAAAHGTYRRGLKEGEWTYWRPDGSRRASGSYAFDRQEGVWTSYAADGRTIAAIAWYSHGLAHGPWAEFAEHGGAATVGIQVAGVRVGPWLVAGQAEDCPLPTGWTRRDDGGVIRLLDGDGRGVALIERAGERLRIATPGKVLVCDAQARLVAQVDDGADLATVERLLLGGQAAAAPVPAPTLVAAPVAPAIADEPAAPAEAPHSMTLWTSPSVAPAPLPTTAAAEAPLPAPAAAALEPVAILPGLWTTDQEARAGSLIDRYRGDAPDTTSYIGEAPQGASRARTAWHGKPLPQTRFLGSDGQVLDLSRWKGRSVAVVVMRGFSGQVCIYCAAQTAALAEAAPRLNKAGCEVLVVYPGPADAVPAFLKAVSSLGAKPTELPVALDPGLHLVRKLELAGNLSLPATFLLDKDGVVRWTYIGSSIADRPSVRDIETALQGIAK